MMEELKWLYLDIRNYLLHLYYLYFNKLSDIEIKDWHLFFYHIKEGRNKFQTILINDLRKRYKRKWKKYIKYNLIVILLLLFYAFIIYMLWLG